MTDYQEDGYMRAYDRRRYFQEYPRERCYGPYYPLIKKLAGKGRVLDYGCGHGTLGFMGQQDGLTVDGLDIAIENRLARYHDVSQVVERYDTVLMSHSLEHFGHDAETQRREIKRVMTMLHEITPRIVVALPNMRNLFQHITYPHDWTHNPVSPDNDDFLCYMEELGWPLKKIIRSDIHFTEDKPPYKKIEIRPHKITRYLANALTGFDPTYNIIYLFGH